MRLKGKFRKSPLATSIAVVLGGLAATPQVHAYPVGDEFQVNTTFADDQERADVAMDAAGNFVVVWQHHLPATNANVFAQRFDAEGVPQGAEFQVNTTANSGNTRPAVAMDEDGDFVVVWEDFGDDGSGYGIFAQRYNAAGAAQGSNFLVNTTTEDSQKNPDVAMDPDGDFVVVWEDHPVGNTLLPVVARAQRFGADGSRQGTELAVSTDAAIDHTWPRVAMDADGDFVVSWQHGDVGSNQDVAVRRFDAQGNALGSPVLVNGTTRVDNESQAVANTSVAMDAAGNFVVAWDADNFTGPGIPGISIGIVARRFDSTGAAVGPQFLVDDTSAPSLGKPDAAMNSGGDFIIAYRRSDDSLSGTWVQRYYPDGSPKGAPLRANTFTSFSQRFPATAIDASGNAVAVWESNGNAEQDGDGKGVFGQRLSGRGVRAAGDFNNDFHSDIPWRHALTGGNIIWQMKGFTPLAAKAIRSEANANWRLAGIGDFNRDGNSDLLWRNSATGGNAIWLMAGFDVLDAKAIPPVPGLQWEIAGVGDFNRDGRSDIVWRHAATGGNAIWLMNGFVPLQGKSIETVANLNWKIAGVDDFDGDGRSDLLWRNMKSGDNSVWLMEGFVRRDAQLITRVAEQAWQVAGTGDFDRDGKSDILWRKTPGGQNAIWLMDGVTVADAQLITAVPDQGWKVERVGDFNRDVGADILWRKASTGANAIWLMDGANVLDAKLIPAVSDPNWEIMP